MSTAPPASRVANSISSAGAFELAAALSHALDLLLGVEAFGIALEDLGSIDVPPITRSSPADQATVRAVAALYLEAELEVALVIPATETLCGIAMTGGLAADLGPAADEVATFWRGRSERLTAGERAAIFDRVFGDWRGDGITTADATTHNNDFDGLFTELCEGLQALDSGLVGLSYGSTDLHARIGLVASELVENILEHGMGIGPYVARDGIMTLRAALALLKNPRIRGAFGAMSPWGVVTAVAQRYIHQTPDIEIHVRRGTAGMKVLSWLADVIPNLTQGSTAVIETGSPIVGAAVTWLDARGTAPGGMPGASAPTVPAHV